jgi:hypothetical protein
MAKCPYCEIKYKATFFNQKSCRTNDDCKLKESMAFIEKQREAKRKKQNKEKADKKKSLMTLQEWIKIAQATFNTYTRLVDKSLNNPCISCRKPLGTKYDAGHFYNANNHWNLRFDERNVHSQCVYCNQHLHGNLLEYRKQLEFYYGSTWLAELEKDANITRKFTIEEVKEINETYKNKIKSLK